MTDIQDTRNVSPKFAALPRRLYQYVAELSGWRAGVFAFSSGALANLAFAPTYLWPVMCAAMVSLVWLLDGALDQPKPRASAMWRTWAFAMGLFGIGFHWIAFAFLVNAGAHLAFVWMALLLPAGLAAIWALVLRVGFNFWSEGPARVVLLALLVFAAEWIRGHIFGGFPWNLPGMAWAPGGAISQSASLFGIYGLSILTMFAFTAPAALIDRRESAQVKGGALGRALPVLISSLVFGMIWGWGAQRLSSADVGSSGTWVRLIDAGAPQSEKFSRHPVVFRRYLEMLEAPSDQQESPGVVIWPEGALPYLLLQDPAALDLVTSRIGDKRLILGSVFEDRREATTRAYNALAVLSEESSSLGAEQIYYKHRLVPFGELVPFRGLAAHVGINALQQLATDGFYAGPEPHALTIEGAPDFLPMICYEALFPGLLPPRPTPSRNDGLGLDPYPEWIVNISIDAWFGPLWAPRQHMDHARYRSIEEGLPMARVASRGVSGIVDPFGRITQLASSPVDLIDNSSTPNWKSRILDAELPNAAPATFFSQNRNGLLLLILVCLGGLFCLLPRR